MEPCNRFEKEVKEVLALVDEQISAIDIQIKEVEQIKREEKRKAVQELFESIGFQKFVTLEMIWDEIKISGHANYAVSGSDIVCAGVTALAQTLIKSIKDLTDDKIEYEISPGRVDIKYGNLLEKSKTLVDSFFIGICMIAEEFPEYVRIM